MDVCGSGSGGLVERPSVAGEADVVVLEVTEREGSDSTASSDFSVSLEDVVTLVCSPLNTLPDACTTDALPVDDDNFGVGDGEFLIDDEEGGDSVVIDGASSGVVLGIMTLDPVDENDDVEEEIVGEDSARVENDSGVMGLLEGSGREDLSRTRMLEKSLVMREIFGSGLIAEILPGRDNLEIVPAVGRAAAIGTDELLIAVVADDTVAGVTIAAEVLEPNGLDNTTVGSKTSGVEDVVRSGFSDELGGCEFVKEEVPLADLATVDEDPDTVGRVESPTWASKDFRPWIP
jgi:hypothetical protein